MDTKVITSVLTGVKWMHHPSSVRKKVPGLFFWLGTRPKNETAEQAASNHSPLFYVDESGLELGVRAMAHVAVDYLAAR